MFRTTGEGDMVKKLLTSAKTHQSNLLKKIVYPYFYCVKHNMLIKKICMCAFDEQFQILRFFDDVINLSVPKQVDWPSLQKVVPFWSHTGDDISYFHPFPRYRLCLLQTGTQIQSSYYYIDYIVLLNWERWRITWKSK